MFLPVQVKPNLVKRLKAGYPWILANDIQKTHRGLKDGDLCDFVDDKEQFIGRGYYNAKSKISGRILTWNGSEKNLQSADYLGEKLFRSWKAKKDLNFNYSFRLCFSEGDELPGLIIDYYQAVRDVPDKQAHVFSVQVSTLGMNRLFHDPVIILKNFAEKVNTEVPGALPWDEVVILLRNDIRVREKEGLRIEIPRFLKTLRDFDFSKATILVDDLSQAAGSKASFPMSCNLYEGQKTGFFLDQKRNIELVIQHLQSQVGKNPSLKSGASFRILDLCCYVGHWSAQLSHALKQLNISAEVTLVDVSNEALTFAEQNARRAGASQVHVLKKDVLKQLDDLESQSYDLVIADPPAFMKSKKDFQTGFHAYQKLNSTAFRVVKNSGWVVSCSCSGHLSPKDLENAASKAIQKNQRNVEFVLSGGPSMDHPMKSDFSEGSYLKMLLNHIVGQ